VSQYQQTAIEGLHNLNFYWSGWLTIFNERGDVIYASSDQKPELLSTLWNQMQSMLEDSQSPAIQHGKSDDLLFSAFSYEPWGWYAATSASVDALSNSVEQIQRSILLWSVLTLSISLLLIFWAVNNVLFVPIEKLRSAARSLADKHYISHIPIETHDIFGRLARDVEVLSKRLQEHDQRLVQTNIELEQRIRERTQELRDKTDTLEHENIAHKKTEKALREQENQYRNIIKYSPDAIFINCNDKILMANDACAQLFGAENPEQLVGRDIYECFHPDYRSFVHDRVKTLREEQLRQARKMDAVGRLAGGVAHDFNNMLGVILGYSELALATPGIKKEVADQIQQVLEAGQRSAELTKQLLTFSRKQATSPVPFDINTAFEGSLKMLRKVIREDIKLEWRPCSGQTTVFLDTSQLDQILVNLCINARDAINEAGKSLYQPN
jgi:PAS domain S-box-containing protein